MAEDKIPVPKKQDATKQSSVLDEEALKPLRTLKGDIARLIAENKISGDELSKIDDQLRNEALEYSRKGGDEKFLETLDIYKESAGKAPPELGQIVVDQSFDEDIEDFVDKSTTDIISAQIPKARQETDKIKKGLKGEGVERWSPKERPGAPLSASDPKPAPLPQPAPRPVMSEPPPTIPAEPPPVKEKPAEPTKREPSPKEKLEEETRKIKAELSTLPQKEETLHEAFFKLSEQKERLESFLEPLLQKERELEEKKEDLELQINKTSNIDDKRLLEERRWVVEDQHRETEQKRWKTDQEIIRMRKELENISSKKSGVANRRKELEVGLRNIEIKKRALDAQRDRDELVKKLDEIDAMKEPLELKWIALNENRKKSMEILAKTKMQEEGIESKMKDLEIGEKEATTAEERHEFESERWKTEESRRTTEKKRWTLEDGVERLLVALKELGIEYQKILTAEKTIVTKVEELDSLISKSGGTDT